MTTSYSLSKSADADFEDIFVYGVSTFGIKQAESYALGLQARFEQIAQHPFLYPEVSQIKTGYRLSVYRSHSIYYLTESRGVLIVRILRSQDVSLALTAETV